MKKIKYLILILPLFFITNVKAECTNYVDFNSNNFIPSSLRYTINSSNSITINGTNSDFFRLIGLAANTDYILSFYLVNATSITLDFYSKYSGSALTKTLLERTSTDSGVFYKYSFNSTAAATSSFPIEFSLAKYGVTYTLNDFNIYLASEYNACSSPTPTYTYTFYVDNEVYATDTVEENTVIELPEPPTKEGYTFTGWTLNGESYTGGAITGDIDIIANFTENQVDPTPSPSTNVDLSLIVPYLILIAALILLIIEINFIRNLFKSRR